MAKAQARYTSADNSVLRSVLYTLWNSKCYVCGRPKEFSDTEIDHIIPQGVTENEMQILRGLYNLSESYDLDAPANLALICRACNGSAGKGKKQDILTRPVFAIPLANAQRLEREVLQGVADFDNSRAVNQALIRIGHADTNETQTRAAFEQHARTVVQTIALFDESKVDYSTSYDIVTKIDASARISLDSRGRLAKSIIEDVAGGSFEEVANEAIEALTAYIGPELAEEMMIEPGVDMYANLELRWDWYTCDIDALSFQRDSDVLKFRFFGTFDGNASASIVQSSQTGDGLTELQGDGRVRTERFSVTGSWILEGLRGSADYWEVEIAAKDREVSIIK